MASNFVQDGSVLTLTAPYTRTSGQGALVGSIFGVAQTAVTSGASGEFAVDGVWSLEKTTSETWAVGNKVYWDNSTKKCTIVPVAGVVLIGRATATAGSSATTGYVALTEAPVLSELLAGPAAASHADAGGVTVTAAEILGGILVADPAGAGRTYTLPTAALLVAAKPDAAVGDIIRCLFVNGADAAETITLAAGTGGGFDTNQTASSRVIPQNSSKTVHIRLTNVTASSEAYVAYA